MTPAEEFNETVRAAQRLLRRAQEELVAAVTAARSEIEATAAIAVAQVRTAGDSILVDAATEEAIRQLIAPAVADAIAAVFAAPMAEAIARGDDVLQLYTAAFRPLGEVLDRVPAPLKLAATRAALGRVLGTLLDIRRAGVAAARANGVPESSGKEGA